MAGKRLSPIYSKHEDDPALGERIDAFVIGLGEWIDSLQDAHAEGAFARAAELARLHASEATAVGYPILQESAEALSASCDEQDEQAARKTIRDITELIQRIRLGHRTAA